MRYIHFLFFIALCASPYVCYSQQVVKPIIAQPDSLFQNPLKVIDPAAEFKTIISKVELKKSKADSLQIIISEYSKLSNFYRSKKLISTQDLFELKELETTHKYELREFLGEQNFNKLITSSPVLNGD